MLSIGRTYVDVEPYVVSLTNVSDGVDGIKGSVDGCSGCAVNKERQMPFAFVPNDQFLQLFRYHSTPAKLNATLNYISLACKFYIHVLLSASIFF